MPCICARSLTASATTEKPSPASPARLASTEALKATSRVCKATLVIWLAASETCLRVLTTPATSSPTCSTLARARCMACWLCAVSAWMRSTIAFHSAATPSSASACAAMPAPSVSTVQRLPMHRASSGACGCSAAWRARSSSITALMPLTTRWRCSADASCRRWSTLAMRSTGMPTSS